MNLRLNSTGRQVWRESCTADVVKRARKCRRLLPCVLAILFLCLTGRPLLAQAQDPAVDPLDLGRVRLGNFAFTPAVWMTGGYDSNITHEPVAFADYELVTVPQAEYWFRMGQTVLNGVSAVELIGYRSLEPRFTLNHFNGISFSIPGAVLQPKVSYSHSNHYARPTGFEIGAKSRRVEDDAAAGLNWLVGGKTTLSADARVWRVNWDADAEYQGSNLRESLNRTSTTGTVGVGVQLTPLTSISAMGQVISDRFEFSPQRDGDSVQVSGLVTLATPAMVSGSALVGYRHFATPHSGALAFNGLVSMVNVAYIRESRTRLQLWFDRGPWYSYSEDLGYYVLTSTAVRYVQTVGVNWEASIFGAVNLLDYTYSGLAGAAGQNTTRTDWGGGLSRRTGRDLRVGMNASHVSSRGGSVFQGWRAIGYLIYGSDRLQRLDRPLPDER
jgi:hypothetical protein